MNRCLDLAAGGAIARPEHRLDHHQGEGELRAAPFNAGSNSSSARLCRGRGNCQPRAQPWDLLAAVISRAAPPKSSAGCRAGRDRSPRAGHGRLLGPHGRSKQWQHRRQFTEYTARPAGSRAYRLPFYFGSGRLPLRGSVNSLQNLCKTRIRYKKSFLNVGAVRRCSAGGATLTKLSYVTPMSGA